MKRRNALLFALVGVFVALAPLAHASPPDALWIEGVYDGGDGDDVVLIGLGVAAVQPLSTPSACPLRAFVARVLLAEQRLDASEPPSSLPARAPPTI